MGHDDRGGAGREETRSSSHRPLDRGSGGLARLVRRIVRRQGHESARRSGRDQLRRRLATRQERQQRAQRRTCHRSPRIPSAQRRRLGGGAQSQERKGHDRAEAADAPEWNGDAPGVHRRTWRRANRAGTTRQSEIGRSPPTRGFHSNLIGCSRFGEDSRAGLGHTAGMQTTVMNPVKAFTRIALGLAIAAMGIYVANADDKPGAAVIGMLLMVAGVWLGVRAARNRLPKWAARTALAVGVIVAAFAAFMTHGVVVTAPLFPQSQQVPSVIDSAPSPQHAAAVRRARELVRAAILEQNLPGVSVAVGAGGTIVWAEGFGWRDLVTRAPVTPDTRFNIGTAASGVIAAVVPLGLTNTGADSAAEWSPEHIGEPEEDFPLFTIIRHVIFRPIGLAPAEPLAGNRATFYVPRSDHNPARGRRLMYM